MIYHALVLREEYYLRGMPKQALQVYLNNITDFVGPNGPQLISLNAPFSVIKAGIVSFKAKIKIAKLYLQWQRLQMNTILAEIAATNTSKY